MRSKRAEFNIARCDPSRRNDCKSPAEIDLFIEDLAIDIWSTFEKFDSKVYSHYPVHQILDLHTSNIVFPNIVQNNLILLDRHEIETEDAIM